MKCLLKKRASQHLRQFIGNTNLEDSSKGRRRIVNATSVEIFKDARGQSLFPEFPL